MHSEWRGESFDGFYPILALNVGQRLAEFFGLSLMIFDQTLTPFFLRLQIAAEIDEVTWLDRKLGERTQSGMVRTPDAR